MLHAADERLRAAEAALARAEASVKAPALTRLRDGSYQNSCGEALHVLASPVRLREARTEQDEAFNREQLRGRVRKGAVVEVDGFSSDDGQHRGCDVRAEAGEDGGEEGDEDGDAANGDECYVSVVADEPNGVPAGWVHNRQVVVGTKLYEACTKLGLQVDASQLTSGKDGRTAVSDEHRGVVFREAFKGLRAARDEARALAEADWVLAGPAAGVPAQSPTGGREEKKEGRRECELVEHIEREHEHTEREHKRELAEGEHSSSHGGDSSCTDLVSSLTPICTVLVGASSPIFRDQPNFSVALKVASDSERYARKKDLMNSLRRNGHSLTITKKC